MCWLFLLTLLFFFLLSLSLFLFLLFLLLFLPHFSDQLDFVMCILGGVPRFVEMLAFVIGRPENVVSFSPSSYVTNLGAPTQLGDEINPNTLLDMIKYRVVQQYGPTFETTLHGIEDVHTLLAFSLFRGSPFKVTRDDNLFGKTVGEMEKEGIIFLTSQEPAHLQIPLFVLLCDESENRFRSFCVTLTLGWIRGPTKWFLCLFSK